MNKNKYILALVSVAQLAERYPMHQKVAGFIPQSGTCRR